MADTNVATGRETMITSVRSELERMQQSMQDWESSPQHAEDAEYKQQFDELREHVMNMEKNLERLEGASDDEWDSVRGTAQEMWDRTKEMYAAFASRWQSA